MENENAPVIEAPIEVPEPEPVPEPETLPVAPIDVPEPIPETPEPPLSFRDEDALVLAIKSNPGMSPEELQKYFGEFTVEEITALRLKS